MKRVLMISAALGLLTPVAAHAQETNADAPVINAPEAVIYTGENPGLDGLSVEDLNALQLARLQQVAYEIADEAGKAPVIETAGDEEPVFWAESEAAASDEEEDATAMGGPYYESEEDAMSDRYMTDDPEAPEADEPPPQDD